MFDCCIEVAPLCLMDNYVHFKCLLKIICLKLRRLVTSSYFLPTVNVSMLMLHHDDGDDDYDDDDCL